REFWASERYAQIREKLLAARRAPCDATREAHRRAMIRRCADPAELARHSQSMIQAWAADDDWRRLKQAEIARQIKLRRQISAESVRAALDTTGPIRGAVRLLHCDRSVFRRFPEVVARFAGRPAYRNHRVVAVRELPGDHDVYCLSVPEA